MPSVVAALSALALWAEPPGDALERLRVCLAADDYECVVRESESLDALDAEARRWALRERAHALLVLGRPADDALEAWCRADPAARAEASWPAPWQVALAAARDRAAPTSVRVEAAAPPAEEQALPLTVVIEGARAGDRAVVAVETSLDGGAALELVLTVPPTACAPGDAVQAARPCRFEGRTTVPASLMVPPGLTLSARVERGDARAADATARRVVAASRVDPLPIQPAAAAVATPYYETWWFWTATLGGAALVAGAAVLTWSLLDTPSDNSAASGAARETGDVRVEVLWPGSGSR